jgi:RimJ/RimL family protein N-acetyltransferase
MKLSVREMTENEIGNMVDYFIDGDSDFLKGMGADKSKFPKREEWISKLESDFKRTYAEKEFYYIIWLIDEQPIGHSNINQIEFGKTATMHLHLWDNTKRKKGLGFQFLLMTIPCYFENFNLEKLICEPFSKNVAPNLVLKKLGFNFIRSYDTKPGWINFYQKVNRFEMKKDHLKALANLRNSS